MTSSTQIFFPKFNIYLTYFYVITLFLLLSLVTERPSHWGT